MIAERCSRLVRAQASCARRARAKASTTSSSVDCGTWASGAPLIGERTSAVSPDVARMRRVSASTYSGSRA